MSEDGFFDYFEEPNMEIQIETLLGTCFDIRVSSSDTIRDIKQRIHRVEGIPVQQQNLIFQSKELKDSYRLVDVGIKNGSTLKLVLNIKGGPISTKRLSSAFEYHMMLKELKDLLENTREEIGEKLTPGAKVSVLVFKEGDIINLLRVIENDDGSYSPYEKPISPPSKPSKREFCNAVFEKLIEDSDMVTKVEQLRKKMEDVSMRRQSRLESRLQNEYQSLLTEDSDCEEKLEPDKIKMPYKLLNGCSSETVNNINLEIFERTLDDDTLSETEEIALKDKHRIKSSRLIKNKSAPKKSLYSETKGAYSNTKYQYTRNKKEKEPKVSNKSVQGDDPCCSFNSNSPVFFQYHKPETSTPKSKPSSPLLTEVAIIEENKEDLKLAFNKPLPLNSTRNHLHLSRLVLPETPERPKSTDSIELEENIQDLLEIHEQDNDNLKQSATCKVGLYKRRQSIDFGCESLSNGPPNRKSNLNEYKYCCSSSFYQMSEVSAISPQSVKNNNVCDYYLSTSTSRSSLYSREINDQSLFLDKKVEDYRRHLPALPKLTEMNKRCKYNFVKDCASIQRLRNDQEEARISEDDVPLPSTSKKVPEDVFKKESAQAEDCRLDQKPGKSKPGDIELPPIVKRKARCNQCNKRLNITNIYNCRCGKIFCSQHRYSEAHNCSYDYKTEGKKILAQQNLLVTAEKLNKI